METKYKLIKKKTIIIKSDLIFLLKRIRLNQVYDIIGIF